MKKDRNEYIKFLEEKLSRYQNIDISEKSINNIFEYDALLTENKRLFDENNRLAQSVIAKNLYINYLSNSKWWKLSFPFRRVYRYMKNINNKKVNYISDTITNIKDKVSIIIFSYNNEATIKLLIENINKQKHIKDKEIIIVTRNSKGKLYKEIDNIKYINIKDLNITNDQIYIKVLPYIDGKYIALIDQNTIIDTNDWLYKSLVPIINNQAIATLFFNKDINFIKETHVYPDLKNRLYKIKDKNLLFLPNHRDIIQNISPLFLDNTSIIVKKRISNYYMI